jgi:NitT/TauT family transport system substrate-binding protein
VLTPEAAEIGLGDVNDARMSRAIAQIVDSYELGRTPSPAEVFDRSFLPPKSARLVKSAF